MVSQETLDAIGAAVGDFATQFSEARSEDQVKFYELDFRLKAVEALEISVQRAQMRS